MTDPRHLVRTKIIQNLYAWEFSKKLDTLPYPEDLESKKIISYKDKIDSLFKKYVSRLPIEEMAKVDLAILRWSVYEIFFVKKLPYKVVINEAVELAKELSGAKSYSFVNGVLGSLVKDYFNESDEKS